MKKASLRGTDTLSGIAATLGIPYSTLRKYALNQDFPQPVARLSSIRIYNVIEVARYMGKPIRNF